MNIANAIRRMFRRSKKPPVIMTQWGPATEWARKQAIVNMKADPERLKAVKAIIIRDCGGSIAKGEIEFRRRFPELYEEE